MFTAELSIPPQRAMTVILPARNASNSPRESTEAIAVSLLRHSTPLESPFSLPSEYLAFTRSESRS
jgi:hypothetical protein